MIGERLVNRLNPATVILDRGGTSAVPVEKRYARRVVGPQSDWAAVSGISAWAARAGFRVREQIGSEQGAGDCGAASAIFQDRTFANHEDEPVPAEISVHGKLTGDQQHPCSRAAKREV